jgi:formamidopyrimidine-DNA glycosylase
LPELPEVETIVRGLASELQGFVVQHVIVRQKQLRWPIPDNLASILNQQKVCTIYRRGKYLLFQLETGTLLIHLGMSGHLRVVSHTTALKTHDHVDIIFSDQKILRYNDPRRFGAMLWTEDPPEKHRLLLSLGVEPLSAAFTTEYLLKKAKKRHVAIKPFIMNNQIVVGVGNIYATEALFKAGIHPATPVNHLSIEHMQRLITAIKDTLQLAISKGGTTLKDFFNAEGKPGYFKQQLMVYGREGLPCFQCTTPLQKISLGQRSSVFCNHCQPMVRSVKAF